MVEWSGTKPAFTAPSIGVVTINDSIDTKNIYIQPGEAASVSLYMLKKEEGPLLLRWELQEEAAEYLSTSYKTQKPTVVADSVWRINGAEVAAQKNNSSGGVYTFRFRAPEHEGPFRF